MNKICFIIATRNRPAELLRLLQSLEKQTYRPDSIIIVDASDKPVKELIGQVSGLKIDYLKSPIASAAQQRNSGLGVLAPEITLVGFLDDDVVLKLDALEFIMNFWEDADKQVAGAASDMINAPDMQFSSFKLFPLAEKLKLYSQEKGKVLTSGFHTMIGKVSQIIPVEWLPSCATVWRRNIFNEFKFDEWFTGYSYLEDLDFSYRVSKKYKLVVLPKPKYYHYPSYKGRESGYLFGKKEVLNRIYFVKKHKELSLFKCYLSLFIRMFISLINLLSKGEKYYLQRILGNIVGIVKSI